MGWGITAIVMIAISAVISISPLVWGQHAGRKIADENVDIQVFVDLRTRLGAWQFFAEPEFARFSSTGAKLNPTSIATAAQLVAAIQAQIPAGVEALTSVGLRESASALSRASAAFTKATTALGPLVAGQSSAVIASTVAAERAAFLHLWSVASTSAGQLRAIAAIDLRKNDVQLSRARTTVTAMDIVLALVAAALAIVFGQRVRRKERVRAEARRQRTFESVLQDALDMSATETEAYDVMTDALVSAVPHLQTELLVADSSRAHFHRTLCTVADSEAGRRDGCSVASPLECPATIRGHTLQFATSRALNACPYLKNRASGACLAVCVPVSISGKTVGVVHATGAEMTAADVDETAREIRYLEMTSRRVSERVAMLRAFEKSETQAQSDPLTGLLNRRSLENRVHALQRDRVPYALAYGDLDHFKNLNDTHGHEAGDQALRLFARVLRESVRPDDGVCRYGGEEFVIVFPNCNADNAIAILERLRERLALTLTSGRVPPFTASFGVSVSAIHETFDETVASADRALLKAKAAGRNRVLLADEARAAL